MYPFSTFADNKASIWQNEMDQIVQIQSDRERLIKDMNRRMLILQNRFDQLVKILKKMRILLNKRSTNNRSHLLKKN